MITATAHRAKTWLGTECVTPGCSDQGPSPWNTYFVWAGAFPSPLDGALQIPLTQSPQRKNPVDKWKNNPPDVITWILCSLPAVTYSIEGQLDLAWLVPGISLKGGVKGSSHGQLSVYYAGGDTWGYQLGAALSVSPQIGLQWNDAERGRSQTDSIIVELKAAEGLAGGGLSSEFDLGGLSGSAEGNGRGLKFGPSFTIGGGAFAHAGRMQGEQFSSGTICVR